MRRLLPKIALEPLSTLVTHSRLPLHLQRQHYQQAAVEHVYSSFHSFALRAGSAAVCPPFASTSFFSSSSPPPRGLSLLSPDFYAALFSTSPATLSSSPAPIVSSPAAASALSPAFALQPTSSASSLIPDDGEAISDQQLSLLPPATRSVLLQHRDFKAMYGQAGTVAVPLQDWLQTFYRRPRADLLLGAVFEALRMPGAMAGPSSLPSAVFLSQLLKNHLHTAGEAAAFYATLLEALPRYAQLVIARTGGNEVLDAVLRAMFLADRPHFDAFLGKISEEWQQALEEEWKEQERGGAAASSASPAEEREESFQELQALAASILPPEGSRHRLPLLDWPIPSLNLPAFEKHLQASPFSLYGCTRYFFELTHAAHLMAKRNRPGFVSSVPELATEVTKAMVDSYWSLFYASGSPACIAKVLDACTPYADFWEEYGPLWFMEWDGRAVQGRESEERRREQEEKGLREADRDYSLLPEELQEDPYSAMRFESSRYALWTLLMNVGTHTRAAEAFVQQLAELNDKLAVMDPFTRAEQVTVFAEKRVQLMKALLPLVAQLGAHADQHGIGSGKWPASYKHAVEAREEKERAAALLQSAGAASGLIDDGRAEGSRSGSSGSTVLGAEVLSSRPVVSGGAVTAAAASNGAAGGAEVGVGGPAAPSLLASQFDSSGRREPRRLPGFQGLSAGRRK